MAGGPATYVFDAFGPFAGMQASLWYWTSCLIGNVAIAAAASGYLAAFFGIAPAPRMMAFITIVLLWLVTAVNLVSPRFAGLFNGPLLIAGLVPLLLIGTVGWFMFDPRAVPRELERERRSRTSARSSNRWCWCSGRISASRAHRSPPRWSRIPNATWPSPRSPACCSRHSSIWWSSAAMMGLAPASDLAAFNGAVRAGRRQDVRPRRGPAGRAAPAC